MAITLSELERLPAPRTRRRAIGGFFMEPKAAIGGILLGLILFGAVFAPFITPQGEHDVSPADSLQSPSLERPFGTDRLGRDIYSRVVYGARVSVIVGVVSAGLAVVFGVPLGLLAGYVGGAVDDVIMRFVDAWIAFPNLILVLAIITIIGGGVFNVMIAIGLGAFPLYARLIRGQTLSLKQMEYVTAARAMGAGPGRVMWRHILPNGYQPLLVQASLFTGSAVIAEAGLSFLGIGVQPPTATWGIVISDGFQVIRTHPWGAIVPGFPLVAFVMSVNLLGDRIRDLTDPRLRGVVKR